MTHYNPKTQAAQEKGHRVWKEAKEMSAIKGMAHRHTAHPHHPVGIGWSNTIRVTTMADHEHFMIADDKGVLGVIHSSDTIELAKWLIQELKRPGWIREQLHGYNFVEERKQEVFIAGLHSLKPHILDKLLQEGEITTDQYEAAVEKRGSFSPTLDDLFD